MYLWLSLNLNYLSIMIKDEKETYMNHDFINLTTENLADEHLCCIIRSKKIHPGIEAKKQ